MSDAYRTSAKPDPEPEAPWRKSTKAFVGAYVACWVGAAFWLARSMVDGSSIAAGPLTFVIIVAFAHAAGLIIWGAFMRDVYKQ